MGEFFRETRRKECLFILAVTCFLAAGWIRSFSLIDVFSTPLVNIVSVDHSLILLLHKTLHPLHLWGVDTTDRSAMADDTLDSELRSVFVDFNWHFLGKGFGIGGGPAVRVILLPYWSLVIPLTVLSAFLLLSKPLSSIKRKTGTQKENSGQENRDTALLDKD